MNDIDTYHMKGHTKLIEKEILCSGDPEEENNRKSRPRVRNPKCDYFASKNLCHVSCSYAISTLTYYTLLSYQAHDNEFM